MSSTTLASIVARGLSLVSLVVLAHALPVEEMAVYVVQVALAEVFTVISDGGFFALVTRMASQNSTAPLFSVTRAADRCRAPAWTTGLLVASAATIVPLWPHATLVCISLGGAYGKAETDTISGELRAHQRVGWANALQVLPPCLALGGAFFLYLTSGSALAAVIVFALSRAIPPVLVRLGSLARRPRARRVWTGLSWRKSLPFALTAILATLYIRSDLFLLSALGTSKRDVALYGVAYTIALSMQLIPASIAAALFPRFSAATDRHAHRMYGYSIGVGYTVAASVLIAYFCVPEAVFGIFGSSYRANASRVDALIVIALPMAVSLLAVSALQARGHERTTLRLTVCALVMNLSLNALLIPHFGVRGALVATACTETVLALLIVAFATRLGFPNLLPFLAVGLPLPVGLAVVGPDPWLVSLALAGLLIAVVAGNVFRLRDRLQEELRSQAGPSAT